LPGPALEAP